MLGHGLPESKKFGDQDCWRDFFHTTNLLDDPPGFSVASIVSNMMGNWSMHGGVALIRFDDVKYPE